MATKKIPAPEKKSRASTAKKAAVEKPAAKHPAKQPPKPAKRTPAAKPKVDEPVVRERPEPNPDRLLHQIIPYILIVAAIFLLVCFILSDAVGLEQPMGVVGGGLRALLCGLWSWAAFYIPFVLVYLALIWRRCIAERILGYKVTFALISLTLSSALIEAFFIRTASPLPALNPIQFWQNGCTLRGGGVLGGLLGGLCFRGFGFVGTLIVLIALLLVFLMFFFGFTPSTVVLYVRYWMKVRAEKKAARAAEPPIYLNKPHFTYDDTPAPVQPEPPAPEKREPKRRRFDVDVPVGNKSKIENIDLPIPDLPDGDSPEENPIDPAVFDAVMAESKQTPPADADPFVGDVTEIATAAGANERLRPTRGKSSSRKIEEIADETLDLKEIFTDPDTLDKAAAAATASSEQHYDEAAEGEISLSLERSAPFGTPSQAPARPTPPPPPAYVFPPISLLKVDPAPPSGDVRAELQQNAEKLVETLHSFNVRTKIVNVSRGPTITRYELQPEAGTRVRSIANLVDDIALNLATTGVRIEAPIPGKAAVGIEVPNKVVATVYGRELIESEAFRNHKSNINVCLGKDVAGAPVYCDLAKMPHMLIAGTTGSGKSVCINSIILSILYKATPEEVKLILIDPKKVELNIYSGIPHLLVPVVSD
ncbi:MAG: DNA translocase FtsK 4TM domain-containing protein, partial [Clostridia bacterium]|nr:DNA translocase FtsK 4TM domain-containing protein [Clostridia bacterium]